MEEVLLQFQAKGEKVFSPCIDEYTDQEECIGYMPTLHIDQYTDQ